MSREEAAIATFLYDAFLRGSTSPDVSRAAAAYPKAGALASIRAAQTAHRRQCLWPARPPRRAPATAVISRVNVVSCACRTALLFSLVVRIVALVLAGAMAFQLGRAVVSREGGTVADLMNDAFNADEMWLVAERAAGAAGKLRDALEWVGSFCWGIDNLVYSSEVLTRVVPEENMDLVVLAGYFVAGVLGGVVLVFTLVLASLLVGFAAGIALSCVANIALLMTGGLHCQVDDRARPAPVPHAFRQREY